MRFRIIGANRETGHSADFFIEAPSESEALEQAAAMGFVTESAIREPLSPPAKSTPVPISLGGLIATQVVIIVVLAVGLGVPLFQMLEPAAKPLPVWEYRIESPSDISFDSDVNRLGNEGWELVFARRATSGTGEYSTASYEMIFKRPKR